MSIPLVMAALLAACGANSPVLPASSLGPADRPTRTCPVDSSQPEPLDDVIVAAYPDVPDAWLPAINAEAAAIDLVALWGLPLYAYDEVGQLRAGLVRDAVVLGHDPDGWSIRLVLCDGDWSDGQPVVAEDVVATIEALRDTPAAAQVAPIVAARVDGPDVVLSFAVPTSRWQHVLADIATILPAHVLAARGVDAWHDDIPVSGGPFSLASVEPGLRSTFVANVASALGAPATATVEVLLVPRFELALGLLTADDVDLALGYLALEVPARVADVGGLETASPRGGTLLTWRWEPAATITAPAVRAGVHAALDLREFAEGLLGEAGEVTTSLLPGQTGPSVGILATVPDGVREIVLASSRWHEIPSLTARALRDSLERRGATVRTVADEADELERSPIGDARVVLRRFGPWPSLTWLAGSEELPVELSEALAAADAAPGPSSPVVRDGQAALRQLAHEVPLVNVAVDHVWRPELHGLVPSAWPGIGFTSASSWTQG